LLAILAFASLAASPAHAAGCLTADEAAAERVRRLQTTLMIGALQCRREAALRMADIYNQVVRRYGAVISAHNKILTRYFQRTHGAGYQAAMDSHVTSMANIIARSAQRDPGFCGAAAQIGQQMLKPDAADIVDQANWAKLVDIGGPPACQPARTLRAESAAQ